MARTEEQELMVAELNSSELAKFKVFCALPAGATGMDGIGVHSCINNGWDTAKELGICKENGFSGHEIQTAYDRATIRTAEFFELI